MTEHAVESEAERGRAVRRVLLVEMLLNLTVAAAKGGFGLATGSLAIATDGVHSLVDASANVIAIVAMRAAAAPPDDEHPYGHRKFEIAAAMFIGIAIGIAALEFALSAIRALAAGREPPTTSAAGFAILLGTWAVNIFVTLYERRRGRQLESELLLADAAHTGSDVLVTAAVLGSYGAAHAGFAWADPIGALVVVGFIAVVAFRIIRSNLGMLVDRAMVDADQVRDLARAVPGVVDCHRVRSRGTTRAAHVDLHIQVAGELTVRKAHDLAHEVESALRTSLPSIVDVTVHVEPDDDAPESL